MDELKVLLLEYFSHDLRFHTKEELKKNFNLKGEEKDIILNSALLSLEEEGSIFFDAKKGYRIFDNSLGFAFGELTINKSGTGFVHTSDGYTILIENSDLCGALNGDMVVVSNILNKRKDYYHGEIYKIVKRKTGNVIFEVIGNYPNCSIVPYNINQNINVNIDYNKLKTSINGDLILVNVGCDLKDGEYKGEVIKTVGHKDDPDIDLKVIFEENNIPIDFSEEVMEEAIRTPKNISDEEMKSRVDLRSENIFTIDCDNTKDRDDAVGIKKLDNGNYLLKVNISHVSHYIKENSKLFEEAIKRCFSHYLANTCNPMFPHIISNGICSLNQDVDRLTRTVEMEIDSSGEVVNYNIYKSVINSKKEMSYSNVNKVLNGEYVEGYMEYSYDLKLMNELNSILENARRKRDYLNFDTTEVKILEKDKKIIGFEKNDLGLAGQIIENFMLIANTTVYRNYAWFALAYRVHECPDEDKVKEVIDILRLSGINIPKIKNVNNRSLRNIIDNLGDDEVSSVALECLLRSMKKARYDTNNIGHFALNYDIYGHFTSPIRRVIDLLTHTIIDNIDDFNVDESSFDKFEKLLNYVCKRSNEIEKVSKQMEEDANDLMMSKYMQDKIGEEFDVIVTDIGKNSMMVRTSNLIRGKVKLEDILDDKYYYDYDKKCIIGRNTKKKYKIGNKLVVLVKDANPKMRTVNFEVTNQKTKKL
ncbi:MAG: VacB/RNase II family 3'-5' exoribonuclease [bacterium]|nr:VacB/RNase II family 3'-5' exoribonuclease [bacterium]